MYPLEAHTRNLSQELLQSSLQNDEPLICEDTTIFDENQYGTALFTRISKQYPLSAGKITGMLMEMDTADILHLFQHPESSEDKVAEAVEVLYSAFGDLSTHLTESTEISSAVYKNVSMFGEICGNLSGNKLSYTAALLEVVIESSNLATRAADHANKLSILLSLLIDTKAKEDSDYVNSIEHLHHNAMTVAFYMNLYAQRVKYLANLNELSLNTVSLQFILQDLVWLGEFLVDIATIHAYQMECSASLIIDEYNCQDFAPTSYSRVDKVVASRFSFTTTTEVTQYESISIVEEVPDTIDLPSSLPTQTPAICYDIKDYCGAKNWNQSTHKKINSLVDSFVYLLACFTMFWELFSDDKMCQSKQPKSTAAYRMSRKCFGLKTFLTILGVLSLNFSMVSSSVWYATGNEAPGSWSSFLAAYGIWQGGIYDEVTNTYSELVDFPSTTDYTFSFSVDNYGYIQIDDTVVINRPIEAQNFNFRSAQQATITVTAGTHLITVVGTNINGPAAMAATIEPNALWSTYNALDKPTGQPTGQPSSQPTSPTGQPTGQPSSQPTSHTGQPTGQPTSQPTSPTGQPTGQPTSQPTSPTGQPTGQPTGRPTGEPTFAPTKSPTTTPSFRPTVAPSYYPTFRPTSCNCEAYCVNKGNCNNDDPCFSTVICANGNIKCKNGQPTCTDRKGHVYKTGWPCFADGKSKNFKLVPNAAACHQCPECEESESSGDHALMTN